MSLNAVLTLILEEYPNATEQLFAGNPRERLSGILNMNFTLVGVRQNDQNKRISAWAAIVAVPTVIAGIYGMNFEFMPELEWPFGYPSALGVMALICVVLYVAFKRIEWL